MDVDNRKTNGQQIVRLKQFKFKLREVGVAVRDRRVVRFLEKLDELK